MTNKEILQGIVLDDGIENISFNNNTFTIYLGDVLNTIRGTGQTYTLQETYVEIPYSFEPSYFKLHRGVVNEFECDSRNYYKYSGFVHYNGFYFCYGQSGVDHTANIIRSEGLDSDRFNMFLIKLKTFLSVSSHNTMGDYRTIQLNPGLITINHKVLETCNLNGVVYPLILEKSVTTSNSVSIDYSKPYHTVIKKVTDKQFIYNNVTITPKIVKHGFIGETNTVKTLVRVDIEDLLNYINSETIKNKINEINNSTPITLKNLLHQLPDQYSGVDGCVYI